MRKTGLGVVTYAPWLGMACALAMGAAMGPLAVDALAHGTHTGFVGMGWEQLPDPYDPGDRRHRTHNFPTDAEAAEIRRNRELNREINRASGPKCDPSGGDEIQGYSEWSCSGAPVMDNPETTAVNEGDASVSLSLAPNQNTRRDSQSGLVVRQSGQDFGLNVTQSGSGDGVPALRLYTPVGGFRSHQPVNGTGLSMDVVLTGSITAAGTRAADAVEIRFDSQQGHAQISLGAVASRAGAAVDLDIGAMCLRAGTTAAAECTAELEHDTDTLRSTGRAQGNVTLTVGGDVSAGTRGIVADHHGVGNLAITAMGTIDAGSGSAVEVVKSATSVRGDISLTLAGAVSGGAEGILVSHPGAGDVTVAANGAITANGHGVWIDQTGGLADRGDISIATQAVTSAGGSGILLDDVGFANRETSVAVSAGGRITADAPGFQGVDIDHRGSGDITVAVAGIEAGGSGIRVRQPWNSGKDPSNSANAAENTDMRLTATGFIDAGMNGIDARHGGTGGDLVITAASITAGETAIRAEKISERQAPAHGDIIIAASGSLHSGSRGIEAVSNAESMHDGVTYDQGADIAIDSSADIFARGAGPCGDEGATANDPDSMTCSRGIDILAGEQIDDIAVVSTGRIFSGHTGVRADHQGTGMLAVAAGHITADEGDGILFLNDESQGGVSITSTGRITALSGAGTDGNGIRGRHMGTGSLSVSAHHIRAGNDGVSVGTNTGAGSATFLGTGTITAGNGGVALTHRGTGLFRIVVNEVSAAAGTAVRAVNESGGGATTITATGDVSGGTGIDADISGATGAVVVTLGGSVAGTGGTAIDLAGGASHRLVLNPGAGSFTGAVTSDRAGSVMEFAADTHQARISSFDLSQLAGFTNFSNLDKTGGGAWDITGRQPQDKAFASADFAAGTLRFRSAELRTGAAFTIPGSGTLEIDGASTLHGDLNNASGSILFFMDGDDSADDTLTVTGGYTTGGSLTLDINLTDGTADRLVIDGPVISGGSATTVNLRASGDATSPTFAAGGTVLVDVAGGAVGSGTDFESGRVFAGATEYEFTLTRSATDGDWRATAIGAGRAAAGGCMENAQISGTYVCSGAATASQRLIALSGASLVATDATGFTAGVTTGHGLNLLGFAGSGGMLVTLGGSVAVRNTLGGANAIEASHQGTGDVAISVGAVSAAPPVYASLTSGGRGVLVTTTNADSGLVTLAVNGAVASYATGIQVEHGGTGKLAIRSGDTVTATDGAGIFGSVGTVNTGGVAITADGKITAAGETREGIRVDNRGSGEVVVSARAVEAGAAGIRVDNRGSGEVVVSARVIEAGAAGIHITGGGTSGDLTVYSAGKITAAAATAEAIGVRVDNQGTGWTTVDVGAVESHAQGIDVAGGSASRGIIVKTSGAVESAAREGVRVVQTGDGDVMVFAEGSVAAAAANATGIRVDNRGAGWVTVNARAVESHAEGISVTTVGDSGDITVNASGAVESAAGEGIKVSQAGDGDVAVTATGPITTGEGAALGRAGIYVNNNGGGETRVTAADITVHDAHRGIDARGVAGSGAMTITAEGDISSGAAEGISASHAGTGLLSISLAAGKTIAAGSAGNGIGINARTLAGASGGMAILSLGSVGTAAAPTGAGAIIARTEGDGDVSVTAADVFAASAAAIHVRMGSGTPAGSSGADGNVSVTTTGTVTAMGTDAMNDRGIQVDHYGCFDSSGMARTTAASECGIAIDVRGSVSGATGIAVNTGGQADNGAGVGAVSVTVGGPVAGTRGSAIDIRGGTSHRLVLNSGASIAGGIASSGIGSTHDAAMATLVLNADATDTEGNSLDLGTLSGFGSFDKTGTGTWTLTGAQPMDKAFASALLTQGTLRLEAAEFRAGSAAFAVRDGRTLEIDGESRLHGSLANDGHLSFFTAGDDGIGDKLTITGGYTTGGSLTLNVNLADGTADTLVVGAGVTMGSRATTVNLRASGDLNAPMLPIPLIDVSGTGMAGTFEAGELSQGITRRNFTLAVNGTSGDWEITAIAVPVDGCPEDADTAGRYVCSGTTTATRTISGRSGESLVVEDMAGFSANVATGNAFAITDHADGGGAEIELEGSITATAGHGIQATFNSGFENRITVGDIAAGMDGIDATHTSSAAGNRLVVTTTGTITAGGTGVRASHTGTGEITVEVRGPVASTAPSGTMAIEMTGGLAHKLVLDSGASITGGVASSGIGATHDAAMATLELKADKDDTESNSLDLGAISGFGVFDKTGTGGWTVTGAQNAGHAFTDADLEGGTLRFHAATLRLSGGGDLTVAPGAALEVEGDSMLHGNLTGGGMLALGSTTSDGDTGDMLTITGVYTTGGSVTLNVDIDTGAADKLVVTGGVTRGTGGTTVNLRATGDRSSPGRLHGVVLIEDGDDTSAAGDFMAGRVHIGGMSYPLKLAQAAGDWSVAEIAGTAVVEPPPPCAEQSARGTYVCSGAATATQILSAASGQALMVTDTRDFAPSVASGAAIELRGAPGSTGMTATFRQAITATAGRGVYADHDGSGAVAVTADAIAAGTVGIRLASAATSGVVTVTANGAITAGTEQGIWLRKEGGGGNVAVNANGAIHTGGTSIYARHEGIGALAVTVGSAASLTSIDGMGVEATTAGTATGLTITANGSITADEAGIRAFHAGSGTLAVATAAVTSATGNGIDFDSESGATGVTITAAGRITATASGQTGITGDHDGTGMLSVVAGEVQGGAAGIVVGTVGDTDAGISITATGAVTGDRGIGASKRGSGALTITTADVAAGIAEGILANNINAGGDTTITTSGAVSGRTAGIRVDADDVANAGAVVVSLGGSVTGTDGTAIDIDGGASQRLVLNPGASISGTVSASRTDAVLELSTPTGRSGSTSFVLTGLSGFTGFGVFEKSGTGAWTLTGAQGEGENEFTSGSVGQGTLRLDAATFRLSAGGDLTIASGAKVELRGNSALHGDLMNSGTLEVDGIGVVHGDVVNNGALALHTDSDHGTGDTLTVMGGYTTGGSLTLNVNLDTGAADKLVAAGGVTRGAKGTTVNLRATGNRNILTMLDGLVLIEDGDDVSADGDFVPGMTRIGVTDYRFKLAHSSGDWSVASIDVVTTVPPPGAAPCTEQPARGTYVCSGATTESQTFFAASGVALTVADTPDFDAAVSSGNAIVLRGAPGSSGMTATFTRNIAASGTGVHAGHGIFADHDGTGNVSITTAAVTSAGYRAVSLASAASSGIVGITARGAIQADTVGVHADHEGAGQLVITTMSTVAATVGPGIVALVGTANNGGLTIDARDKITATRNIGIHVDNDGSGPRPVTITAADVESGREGISVDNDGEGDVVITSNGLIDSDRTGILVDNDGEGDVVITSNGRIDSGRTGILVDNDGEGDVVITSNGLIDSGRTGILVDNDGDGDIMVTTSGLVDSDRTGVAVYNGGPGNTTITTAAVEGRFTGILVEDYGRGDIAVTTNGTVAAAIDRGIQLVSGSSTIDATITANDAVSGLLDGIFVDHAGLGKLTITAGSAITADRRFGVRARLAPTNVAGIEINAGGKITAPRMGVIVVNDGFGHISVTTADVEATHPRGIGVLVRNNESDSVTIKTRGDVSGGSGIRVDDRSDNSTIVVTLGGSVTGRDAERGRAVGLTGGVSQKLVLNRGAGIFSGAVSASRTDAVLELNAAAGESGSASFDLAQLGQFTNFLDFDKTGDGTWELTGEQGSDSNEFTSADVTEGALRLNSATFRLRGDIDDDTAGNQPGNLAIASGAALEITGTSTLYGDLVNSGTLALGSTSGNGVPADRFTITGDYIAGGFLTLDVDFASGDADQLKIMGDVTRGGTGNNAATTVNVRAGAAITNPGSVTRPTNPLIDVDGTGRDGDFTAGSVYDGVTQFSFVLTRDPASGDWNIDSVTPQPSPSSPRFPSGSAERRLPPPAVETTHPPAESAEPVPGRSAPPPTREVFGGTRLTGGTIMPSVPSYESYAATIAELSLLPSLQESASTRAWLGRKGDGLWAGVDGGGMRGRDLAAGLRKGSAGEFNPRGTMGSNRYEVDDVRTRFGFETLFGGNMSIGGNFWFGRGGSDVSSAIGDGEIRTTGRGVSVAVRWLSDEGLYADGQVQYAGFTSDILVDREAQVAGNEAFSLSAAAEVGYRLSLGSATFAPRAALNWSDIKFDDFTDPTLARVSLEDGDTLTGLLGVSAGREWRSGDAQGSLHVSADLHLPLDGETGSSVARVSLVNRLQDPVLHLGAGASWKWGDDLHSVYGEVGTAQGGETEGYRAGIGIRIGF